MSGYLARLARRHLEAPAVRPRHESRMAWRPFQEAPTSRSAAGAHTHPSSPFVPSEAPRGRTSSHTNVMAPVPPSLQRTAAADAIAAPRDVAHSSPDDARFGTDVVGVALGSVEPSAPSSPSGEPTLTVERLDGRGAGEEATPWWGAMEPPPHVPVQYERPPAAVPAVDAVVNRPEARAPGVVRIHIGRVDVRAVMAPSPTARPPRAARPSSALSLEQYLAGKRRP